MLIVGLDFGTTNMRISTWDNVGFPQSSKIGKDPENENIMPAVAVLQRQGDGSIKVIAGEDAYSIAGSTATSEVIRNIKRCVLAQDSYVQARMPNGSGDTTCLPHRWNEQQDVVEVLVKIDGQEIWFSAKEIISSILKEAITRADLPDEFEWIAGCPVHANHIYRAMLKDLLPNPNGKGSLNWVVEEPVLVLVAAQRNLNPDFKDFRGSYLVYDLGGGSFDCAVIQISDDEYIVYSADGDPRLGAEDIPQKGKETILKRSIMSLRDTYINAKVVWARGDEDYPFGEKLFEDDNTGEVRFIWQLNYRADIPRDVDGIIVYGGITKDDKDFENYLKRWFGDNKIISFDSLFGGVTNPQLLALSWGACYFYDGLGTNFTSNRATVPIRLPVKVTIENRTTGEKIQYEPYQHFSPKGDFWGAYHSGILEQERDNPAEYEITITDPDGVVLRDDDDKELRLAFSGFMEPRKLLQDEGNRQPATSLQLVIDRLGYVWVEMKSEGIGLPWSKSFRFPDVHRSDDTPPPSPPWQTQEQREAWRRIQERIKLLEEKKRRQVQNILYNQPWRERYK